MSKYVCRHQSVLFTSFDVLRVCGRRVLLTVGDHVSIQATENVDYAIGVGSRGPVHNERLRCGIDRGEQMMDSCFFDFGMSLFFSLLFLRDVAVSVEPLANLKHGDVIILHSPH